MNNWTYQGVEISESFIGDDPKQSDHYAFIYVITNKINGKKYVGKKLLWSTRMLKPLQGQKRRRKQVKPSNWYDYCGSSKYLLADIEKYGIENFDRKIINFYPNKQEANFAELRYQIFWNVLDAKDENGERLWYNENIERVYYASAKYGNQRCLEHKQLLSNLANTLEEF